MSGRPARRGDRASVRELDNRRHGAIASVLAEMFGAAGIGDAAPGSLKAGEVGDWVEFSVHSRSLGRVAIGTVPRADFANLYGDLAREYVGELAGTVELRRGRPSGSTTIENDDQLRDVVRHLRRNGVKATLQNIAANSGFSVAEVRGYLRSTNRSLADFLDTF